jgi:hypothetical protein
MEAPMFLENECALLREAFGLQQLLLQSEEELLAKRSSQAPHEGVAPKPKKNIGKMKVQGKLESCFICYLATPHITIVVKYMCLLLQYDVLKQLWMVQPAVVYHL